MSTSSVNSGLLGASPLSIQSLGARPVRRVFSRHVLIQCARVWSALFRPTLARSKYCIINELRCVLTWRLP
jgi:hypothetical protein